MLISEKMTASIYLFLFASKEAYPIVRQLEKNYGEKSASERSKMREKQILDPGLPRHLSVKPTVEYKLSLLNVKEIAIIVRNILSPQLNTSYHCHERQQHIKL